jgi:hypothetical protein
MRGWPMSTSVRHDLIFGHEGDARAAASVTLIGVVAALIGSVFMAIGPRVKQAPRPTGDTYIGDVSAPVRVVGHAPRENGSCGQQVWPHIDQRCLVRTEATANSSNTSSRERNDKLSPLNVTAATVNTQASSHDVTNGGTPYYGTAPAPSQQDALNVIESSDVMVDPLNDNAGELRQQEPIEPPPKRARRHYRAFHFHFGTFHF